ncbi:protein phosphatase regulator, partial [Massospora cicadina]
ILKSFNTNLMASTSLMECDDLSLHFAKRTYSPRCVSTGAGWETRLPSNDAVESVTVPSHCVDYLTHNWEDEDLARSWRAVARQHGVGVNCARLENASWRIWCKKRNNIPTLNPAELNWHKDNDTTWLYGPLLTHPNRVSPPVTKSSSFVDSMPSILKPALKKRTSLQAFRQQSSQILSRPKLRFNTQVEQYVAVEPAAPIRCNSVIKIANTYIKSECEPKSEFDDFDPYFTLPTPVRFPPPPPDATTQAVQTCYDAISTTYCIFTWARNLLF